MRKVERRDTRTQRGVNAEGRASTRCVPAVCAAWSPTADSTTFSTQSVLVPVLVLVLLLVVSAAAGACASAGASAGAAHASMVLVVRAGLPRCGMRLCWCV